MDYTDDNILFISINKGDEKAFKFLFKSYYPRLKNYLSLIPQHYYKIFFLST